MQVSNSAGTTKTNFKARSQKDKSFGSRAVNTKDKSRGSSAGFSRGAVGEKEISFMPAKKGKQRPVYDQGSRGEKKDRRSASGNVFRRM